MNDCQCRLATLACYNRPTAQRSRHKTLVVRSSDAVVSDSHEVVENGQKILSVVKPSKAPIELGAAKRRIILSDASVVMLMWAFCVAATPTIVIVKSLKFMFESCNNECDMTR